MILTSVRILPNWISTYSPAWTDITQRVYFDSAPEINISVERQDQPYTLAYSDMTLTVNNSDGAFSDYFSQTKIVGTDNSDLRAPMIHSGAVLICRKQADATDWQVVYYGYVDPKSIQFDPWGLECTFTVYSVAKLLEYGNAARVHRFDSIIEPAPYVLFGYDLEHPALPPGGNAVSDGWWKLVGGSALKFFKGDRFTAVAKFSSGLHTEGMSLTELSSSEQVISAIAVDGSDLYIQAADADGKVQEGLLLSSNQALMNILTPWYHGMRVSDLLIKLVDEANAALAAAGYPEVIALVNNAGDSVVLSASAVDTIDNTGFTGPVTGAAWTYSATPSTERYLAESGGPNGIAKADILQDTVVSDRSCPSWNINKSVASFLNLNSADYLQPECYPNPLRGIVGTTPPDIAKVPITPQSRDLIYPYRLSKVLWFVPSASMTSAVGATKYAYRVESYEGVYQRLVVGAMTTFKVNKEVITLYSTTDEGQTWTESSTSTVNPGYGLGSQAGWLSDDSVADGTYYTLETLSQPFIANYPISGGQYLYLMVMPQRRKAYYYVGANDHVAATTIDIGSAGVTAFGDQPGYRSGAVYDGTNIFFFDDSTCQVQKLNTGSISVTNGSAAVVGTLTQFTTELAVGDVISDPSGNLGKYTVDTITDDTHLTLTQVVQEATVSGFNYVGQHSGALNFYYWDGAAMTAGTLSGFPPLTGADFAGAIVDSGRGRMYLMQGDTFYEIAYTFSGGTLTATSYNSAKVDTPNFIPAADSSPNANTVGTPYNPDIAPPVIHPERIAWLCGPVDVLQGQSGETVNYPNASDAILIVTQLGTYIYSNQFGGVISIADFEGMSTSTAISQLVTVPQALIVAGADLTTTTDPTAYEPTPVITITLRRPTAAASVDLSPYAEGCNYRNWYLQYTSVKVTNDRTERSQLNDRTFIYNGGSYTVAAARYGGAKALELSNRFVGTDSLLKYVANSLAYEFLIPRQAGTVTVRDPYLIDGTVLEPLINVNYLQQGLTAAVNTAAILSGRILSVSYSLADNILSVEVA